jgi:DNA-directed RNA polymerase subunit omega
VRRFPIEELVDRVGSCYSVVVAAAKRAKQIKDGAPPLVQTDSRNPLTIALHEIAIGLVEITEPVTPSEEPEVTPVVGIEVAPVAEQALPDLPLIDLSDALGEDVLEEEALLAEEDEEEEDEEDDLDEDLDEDPEDDTETEGETWDEE